jgi:hypothetical protein
LYRERSFLEIRWMDLDLPQLANFLAGLKPGATEEPGDFRSQQPAGFAFALGGIAQDFTHFLFDASPVPLGSPTQFVFHFVLKLPNNELCHVFYDIMIAYDGKFLALLGAVEKIKIDQLLVGKTGVTDGRGKPRPYKRNQAGREHDVPAAARNLRYRAPTL